MNGPAASLAFLRPATLWGRLGVLTALLAGLLLAVAPLAFWWAGRLGLAAAAVSWLVCFSAAVLPLFINRFLQSPAYVLHQMLVGLGVRLAFPLIYCLALRLTAMHWVEAGALAYLLVFYFATLSYETWLLLGDKDRLLAEKKAVGNAS